MQKITTHLERPIPNILQQWKPVDSPETRTAGLLSYPTMHTIEQEQIGADTSAFHLSTPSATVTNPTICV
jgi:hypothetical protein